MKTDALSAAQKMAIAMDLHDAGLALMRQKQVRDGIADSRRNPDRLFRQWLLRRDDPVPGDVSGPIRIRRLQP